MYRYSQLVLITLVIILVTGCQKEVRTDTRPILSATRFKTAEGVKLVASCSELRLVSSNAKKKAVRFNWPAFSGEGVGESYVLETDIAGGEFSDPVEIGYSCSKTIEFTVDELNEVLRRKSLPGTPLGYEFRIRMKNGCSPPMYSVITSMQLSTYDSFREFSMSSSMFVSCNFQNWLLPTATRLVSTKGDQEYEGFIDMPDPTPKFVLVKYKEDNRNFNVYYDMGNGKFGEDTRSFNFVGAGIYKLNLNGATSQWSCTRIENFSLYGDATNRSDLQLQYDNNSQAWIGVANLNAGSFYFRANHADQIRLGVDAAAAAGSVRSNGEAIPVRKTGRYKIVLSLLNPGNYKYALQRMV